MMTRKNNMVLDKILPFLKQGKITASELVKNKEHGEVIVIAGEITKILPPNAFNEFGEEGVMFLDDEVGESLVQIPAPVYKRDSECITSGNIVLVRGVVEHIAINLRGKRIQTDYRVVASSIVPFSKLEEANHPKEEPGDAGCRTD
jgi:hypothetical protein